MKTTALIEKGKDGPFYLFSASLLTLPIKMEEFHPVKYYYCGIFSIIIVFCRIFSITTSRSVNDNFDKSNTNLLLKTILKPLYSLNICK